MASCPACGDTLTGPYCNTCGAKAPEERRAKVKRAPSPVKHPGKVKTGGLFLSRRSWRRVAVGSVGLLLYGVGILTGLWIGQGAEPSVAGLFPLGAQSDGNLEGISDLARADLHLEQGVALLNNGERPAAVSEFRKAIKAWDGVLQGEPQNLYALTYQGLTYYYAGDSQRALQRLQSTLELDPNYLWAIFNLAWIYETGEKEPEALAAYQRYLAVVDQERQDRLKYAEQYELIDRQIEAARQAVARLGGGGKGE